jgi:hypothetical protein
MLHWACVDYFLLFRLKTGNIPPDDLPFEETPFKMKEKCATLGRRKSEQKWNKQKKETELFPKKRNIEDNVASIESDIEKGKIISII